MHLVLSVAHLRPTPDEKNPFDRDVLSRNPIEAEQDDLYEVEMILNHCLNRTKAGFNYFIK
jgi:hypothetical protein